MDDVIPPCGGFLLIQIDSMGYMRIAASGSVIHRETRDLHTLDACFDLFSEAKTRVSDEEHALLELTKEGGGAYIWLPEARREPLEARLRRFYGCYGGWPIRNLSI